MYGSAVFTGGRPLCTQILPGQCRPPSTMSIKKPDTGLADGEDHMPAHSLVFTQHRSVKDGRTDGQTNGFVVAYTVCCKASFAAHCKKHQQSYSTVHIKQCHRYKMTKQILQIPFLPPTSTLVASVFKSRPFTTTPAPNSAV